MATLHGRCGILPSVSRLGLDDTIQAHLSTLGPHLKTLELSPNSTIVPPEPTDTAGRHALGLLAPGALEHELELRDTIGEGGMGVVRSATQRSLGRTVAIKTLRPEHRRQEDVLTLLREAWVTGALEHPNILPIYDVKLDDEGMPLVVLKRIDGVDWGEMMHDAERMSERFGEGDLLEHNLEVLMQVCHAVAFAHSRGIVHRDIKPDNVRIGAFGEVYVLDWGIAVALADDGTGRFPLAAKATAMAGTPSYMAPEMLGAEDGRSISPRTDIYLLGATLCEIATGRPPHDGPSAAALVSSVLLSKPNLDKVPEELAAVIRRAMAPDPEARFESAEAVRVAIRRFLDHRGSARIAASARRRLVELEQLVEGAGEDVRVAAHDLLGACRAGFSAALDVWRENDDAREGLRRAIEIMTDYELRRGDARAAADLLAQIADPPELLEKRVARGLDKQRETEARQRALEALGKDLDPATGTRTRVFVGAVTGTIWCLLPLVGLTGLDIESYFVQAATTSTATVFAGGLFFWARESLTKTAYNRRLTSTVLGTLAAHYVLLLAGWLADLAPNVLTTFYPFLWMCAAGFTALMLESKLWPSVVSSALAFVLGAAFPEERPYLMSMTNAVVTLNLVIAWRLPKGAPPSSELPRA